MPKTESKFKKGDMVLVGHKKQVAVILKVIRCGKSHPSEPDSFNYYVYVINIGTDHFCEESISPCPENPFRLEK